MHIFTGERVIMDYGVLVKSVLMLDLFNTDIN